jgi:pimeloyl-ACP methyl ester carboxylesterase
VAIALALVCGAVLGGSEPTVTGVVLAAFGLGWGLMWFTTTRFSLQPQSWMLVPAIALGVVGLALVALQPGHAAMDALGWVWPLALAALAIWMVAQTLAHLRGRGRWLVLPLIAVLLAFSLGGVITALTTASASAVAPETGQLVDVGGRRLYIECHGSGSPVVVLQAGLSGTAADWSQVAANVAPTTTVCAYDRAGHGWSDPADQPQDGLAIASDLEVLLERAGIAGPYVLVGYSSGGPYTQVFAARYPDEVAGLVFLDAQPADAFEALPDYPAFYAPYRALMTLAPSLARLGVGIPVLGSPSDPAGIGAARMFHDEVIALPDALKQAQELRTIGDRPLVVLTAESGQQAGWSTAQERLAQLSTNADHRVVPTAAHETVLGADAPASVQAILDVVASVRTGNPVR